MCALQLSSSHCRKGRSWLMWSLLHFVTSTVQSKLPAQQQVSFNVREKDFPRQYVSVIVKLCLGAMPTNTITWLC